MTMGGSLEIQPKRIAVINSIVSAVFPFGAL
jgi:hypothetical protein